MKYWIKFYDIAPQERDPPQAFKRSGSFANPTSSKDNLQIKRENHKLKREIERLTKEHNDELETLKNKYEDDLYEMSREKEKEYALILDAKLVEHENQLIDLENRLHQDYTDKIVQYQEIIKGLKLENQALYEESSLKQQKIDEQTNIINNLKQNINQNTITSRRMSSNTDKENLFNNLDISEKLQEYWKKMKNKRNSRTRNSNNLNCITSVTKAPTGSKISIKRWNTSFNGSESSLFTKSVDNVQNLKWPYPEKLNRKAPPRITENISLSSKLANDIQNLAAINNSTFMKLETESENGQTPVKSKINELERQTKEKFIFNTIDDPNSHIKLGSEYDFEQKGFYNQFQWDENEPNRSEESEDEADIIDDSICIDEAPVSQKAINWSFINIKRNKPLEYKLKKFQTNI